MIKAGTAKKKISWEVPLLALAGVLYILMFTRRLPFYWDDYDYLTAFVRGVNWTGAFRVQAGFFYRPLETVAFALLHALFGNNPFYFYLFKALMVSGLALLFYRLIHTLSGNRAAAVTAALLMLAAPPTLRSAMFFCDFEIVAETLALGALLAFILWRRGGGRASLIAVFILMAAASLTKESVRLFPLVMAIYLAVFHGRKALVGNWKVLLLLLLVSLWPNFFSGSGAGLLGGADLNRMIGLAAYGAAVLTPPLLALFILTSFHGVLPAAIARIAGEGLSQRERQSRNMMLAWTLLMLPMLALAPSSEYRYLVPFYLPLAGLVVLTVVPVLLRLRVQPRFLPLGLLLLALAWNVRTACISSADFVGGIAPYLNGLDRVMEAFEKSNIKEARIYYSSWRTELYSLSGKNHFILVPGNLFQDYRLPDYLHGRGACPGDFYILFPGQEMPQGLAAAHIRDYTPAPYRFSLYRLQELPSGRAE